MFSSTPFCYWGKQIFGRILPVRISNFFLPPGTWWQEFEEAFWVGSAFSRNVNFINKFFLYMVKYKSLTENSTSFIYGERQSPGEFIAIWKDVSLRLKDKGGNQDCLSILFILTMELRYPQKRGVNRKRGRLGSWFSLGGGKWLTLGKEGFAWRNRDREKLYRLTIK